MINVDTCCFGSALLFFQLLQAVFIQSENDQRKNMCKLLIRVMSITVSSFLRRWSCARSSRTSFTTACVRTILARAANCKVLYSTTNVGARCGDGRRVGVRLLLRDITHGPAQLKTAITFDSLRGIVPPGSHSTQRPSLHFQKEMAEGCE